MASIIVNGSTITPVLVTGYESTRTTRNVVHPIVGRSAPGVTVRPAGLRHGRMELLFDDETAAATAETVLASAGVCVFTEDDRATLGMSFVLAEDGDLTRTLEDATRRLWFVAFDWQEVTP